LSATKPGKPSKPKQPQNSPLDEKPDEGSGVGFDDLLRRMLSTPPQAKASQASKKIRKLPSK
jgi:hypothetical protein